MSPEPASYDPEEFVDGSQPWPRLLALKDGELLAKGEVFEQQTAARPKPAKHGRSLGDVMCVLEDSAPSDYI